MRKLLVVVLLLAGCAVAFALFSHAPIASRALACVLWFQHKGNAGALLYGALDLVATVLLFPGTPLTLVIGAPDGSQDDPRRAWGVPGLRSPPVSASGPPRSLMRSRA